MFTNQLSGFDGAFFCSTEEGRANARLGAAQQPVPLISMH